MRALLFVAVLVLLFGPAIAALVGEEIRRARARRERQRIMAKMAADLNETARQIGVALLPSLTKVTEATTALVRAFGQPPTPNNP